MADTTFHARLDPVRFSNMSLQMVEILRLVPERGLATLAMGELVAARAGD